MKSKLLRSLSLLIVLIAVASSFCGCFDIDDMAIDFGFYQEKKNVNNRVNVVLRVPDGVTCLDDEQIKNVWNGDRVIFSIQIDRGYLYVSNTGGAKYEPDTGKLIIESVKAPTTIDVEVVNTREVYYVDVVKPETVGIEYVQGSEWSKTPQEVTIKAILPNGYKFVGWSTGTYLDNGGYDVGDSLEYTFTPKKGVNTIYINVTSADE